ncbi:unnamed protein product [Sphagnum balticum]
MSYSQQIADHFALNVECDKHMNPDKYLHENVHYQPLSVSTLRSLFAFLLICLTFAFVCFIGELVHMHYRQNQFSATETPANAAGIESEQLVTYTIQVTCLYDQCAAVQLACEEFRAPSPVQCRQAFDVRIQFSMGTQICDGGADAALSGRRGNVL